MIARERIAVEAEESRLAILLLSAVEQIRRLVERVEERAIVEEAHAPIPAAMQIEIDEIEIRE